MLMAMALMLLMKVSRRRAFIVSCVRTCTAAHLHSDGRVVTRVAGGEGGGGGGGGRGGGG